MYVLRKRAYFGKVVFKEPDTGKVHIRIISKNNRQVGYSTYKPCLLQVQQQARFLEDTGHIIVEVTVFDSETIVNFENEHRVSP